MRIAIIKLSALGDIIHTMTVLQFIKKNLPEATIDWIIEKHFKGILINNPDINQIHTVNLKKAKQNKSIIILLKTFKKLKNLPKYDIVIDTQGLIKSAIVSFVITSNKTFGFDKQSLRESVAAKFYSHTCNIDYAKNIVSRNVAIISTALNITITDEDIINKKSFLHTSSKIPSTLLSSVKPNIVLIPSASFISKIYPLAQYAELSKKLNANFIILWDNQTEKNRAEKIQQISPIVKITKQLTLDELKTLIAQMDLVIGGDTGPTHMAWALNVPSITLFGSTPGYRNAYTTTINKVLESKSVVNPYKINKKDDSIKHIKADDIATMAKQLLKQLK